MTRLRQFTNLLPDLRNRLPDVSTSNRDLTTLLYVKRYVAVQFCTTYSPKRRSNTFSHTGNFQPEIIRTYFARACYMCREKAPLYIIRPQGTRYLRWLRKKSPATPPGIDPETPYRLAAQCLNHYATRSPEDIYL